MVNVDSGGILNLEPNPVVSFTGTTRGGEPLSINRAPAPDLAPWVARLVALKAEFPVNETIQCGLLNDIPYIRCGMGEHWTAQTADGVISNAPGHPMLFGAQTRCMRITFAGKVYSPGIGLRPGTLNSLFGLDMQAQNDRIVAVSSFSDFMNQCAEIRCTEDSPQTWKLRFEEMIRDHITRTGAAPPDQVTTAFEMASFENPNLSVSAFADEQSISVKSLERIIKRDFGLPPKQVLRRARVLDFAAQLCGVTDNEEEEEFLLRYADQSHQIKEFTAFFGMTPRNFRNHYRPIITVNLEIRQARRLEELARQDPDRPRPWRTT